LPTAIHYNSNRKDGPYVVINYAAIHGDLIASELSGWGVHQFQEGPKIDLNLRTRYDFP
jgi:DNA-binding NtrC family response regulator